jgi:hypothetical protein
MRLPDYPDAAAGVMHRTALRVIVDNAIEIEPMSADAGLLT